MITGFIFFGGIILMGIGLLFFGLREFHRKFIQKKSFALAGQAAMSTLFGLVFIIGGIFVCIEIPRSEARIAHFTEQCHNQGGVVLDVENSGMECWQNRIEIEGY